MEQQSAVEFAVEKLEKLIPSGNQIAIYAILEQAKEMEKEQIEDAYKNGWDAGEFGSDCWEEIYYNKTFKTK